MQLLLILLVYTVFENKYTYNKINISNPKCIKDDYYNLRKIIIIIYIYRTTYFSDSDSDRMQNKKKLAINII